MMPERDSGLCSRQFIQYKGKFFANPSLNVELECYHDVIGNSSLETEPNARVMFDIPRDNGPRIASQSTQQCTVTGSVKQ